MLRISLRPSRLLAVILTLAHAAAVAVVLAMNFPQWLNVVAIALLIAQWLLVVRRQALLLGDRAAIAIEVTSDHCINVETRSAGWCEYDVLGSTYVAPYMTVLNLRLHSDRTIMRLPLLPDSLAAEDFRKLRVWLQWKEDSVQS